MLKLRKFLCACFDVVAVVYGVAVVDILVHLVRDRNASPQPSRYSAPETFGAVVPHALAVLIILLVPLIVAVLSATARFTIRSGRPSGRTWAIAASTAMIMSNVVFLIGLTIIFDQTRSREIATFWLTLLGGSFLLALPLAALGVAGLVAFWRDDVDALRQVARKPPRVSGDGTNPVLDALALVIALAGFLAGMRYFAHWGTAHHLPGYEYGFPLTLVFIGLLITATVHEAGHATVGMALGMKLWAFIVGPFQWRIRDGQWRFQFVLKTLFGGATVLVPPNPNQSKAREIAMIGAGPVAGLLFGIVALGLLLHARGQGYERLWGLLAIVVILAFLSFIGNLIPLNPDGMYSDGARIYQLLKGGAWADYRRIVTLSTSTLVTPLRPRDFDLETIQRAEQAIARGLQGALLRMTESDYHLDRGELEKASQASAEAENICRQTGVNVPPEMRVGLAFRAAFLRRDAQSARDWWNQVEKEKSVHKGSNYWLAKSALLAIEGQTEEAWSTWNKASDLMKQLSNAGDYEFDRYRCDLMRQAISSMHGGPSTPALTGMV